MFWKAKADLGNLEELLGVLASLASRLKCISHSTNLTSLLIGKNINPIQPGASRETLDFIADLPVSRLPPSISRFPNPQFVSLFGPKNRYI